MVPLYRHFSREFGGLDYSDEMLFEMYMNESYGDPCTSRNGYYHGKKWMDVTVAAWKEDIERGILFVHELYEDPSFPNWWLDKIFSKKFSEIFSEGGPVPKYTCNQSDYEVT